MVSIQSPFAVLLDELVELCDSDGETADAYSGSDGASAMAAAADRALSSADALRAIELLLPHVERRLVVLEAGDDDVSDGESADRDALADRPSKRQRREDDGTVLGLGSSPASGERRALDRLRAVLAQVGADALFPPTEGVGLYADVTNLNHSCRPNAVVVFERDSTATVAALRDIAAGEEVLISYIEEDRPLAVRRADLVDYGFVCMCERCVEEETKAS